MRRKWTDAERETIKRMWLANVPRKEIMEQVNATPGQIAQQVARLGLNGVRRSSPVSKTPESDLATIREKFAQGWSAGAIARHLNVSKGVISGRLRRMGLSRTGGTQKHANDSAKRQAKKRWCFSPRPEDRLPPRLPVQSEPTPDGLVGLMDLGTHSCRWPFGQPGQAGFGFCGARKHDPGLPYCEEHMRRAYGKHPKL